MKKGMIKMIARGTIIFFAGIGVGQTFTIINDNQRVGFEIVKTYGNSKVTQTICLYDNFERIIIRRRKKHGKN